MALTASLLLTGNRVLSVGCSKFCSVARLSFVPEHEPATREEVSQLEQLIRESASVLVLTGAGISTESGLPDYRSAGVGLFARTNHKPITIQEFVKYPDRRRAYWARNFVAWDTFSSFKPGIAHRTLAQWQTAGKVSRIITQNVDRLHQKAGSRNVIELHGNSYTVACLSCDYSIARQDFQTQLLHHNHGWESELQNQSSSMRPDGDVMLEEDDIQSFKVPACPSCGGLLKPTVVFFGDNVPKSVVEESYRLTDSCDLLLVIGSSLYVMSGFRFVCRAHERGKRVAIVNIGCTRADQMNGIRFVRRRAGDVLSRVQVV